MRLAPERLLERLYAGQFYNEMAVSSELWGSIFRQNRIGDDKTNKRRKLVDKWVTSTYSVIRGRMKFVTVRDLRTSPAQVWNSLSTERELVVTKNGRPIALLTPISDATMEDTIRAMRRALAVNAVKKLQLESARAGHDKTPAQDIEREIRQSRNTRAR